MCFLGFYAFRFYKDFTCARLDALHSEFILIEEVFYVRSD